MRLAVLINRAGPATAPLFRQLQDRGVDLLVYYCTDFGAGRPDFDPEFQKHIDWGRQLFLGYQYKFSRGLNIVSELFKNQPNTIIIFGWGKLTFWFAYFAAIAFKIPFVIWGENPLNQERLKTGFKQACKRKVLQWLFKRAAAFLFVGEENREFYKAYGVPERKLFFAPYAVDNDYFVRSRELLAAGRNELRQALGIKKDETVILFVGALIEKKRPMDLLKAYQELNTDTHLIFVGSGPLEERLKNYAKRHDLKNVHWVGFQSQAEISKYYVLADIFVLPSGAGETWGLVVNEAMCFGLPILASDMVGSVKDLIKPGENGYVFPCGDILQLSEFLKVLILNPEQRKTFGNKSVKIIRQYDYEKAVTGILNGVTTATQVVVPE